MSHMCILHSFIQHLTGKQTCKIRKAGRTDIIVPILQRRTLSSEEDLTMVAAW